MRIAAYGPTTQLKVATAEQMRRLDRCATEDYGIPSFILMENAGRAVAQAAISTLGNVINRRVLVVAGQGNNGGDGFVAARHLSNAGALVSIAYFGERDKAKGDALLNIEIAEKMGLNIEHNPYDVKLWESWHVSFDLVIDALLGTGLKGEVRKPLADVVDLVNGFHRRKVPIIAVDIPSGLDADTGAILGSAVKADKTVTFGLPKIGLITYPGAANVGDLIIADISIPARALVENDIQTYLLTADHVASIAKPRPPDAHKGRFGHCAVVAGSVGMTGAAALTAQGALRIGTGLVTMLVPESLNDIMEVKVTEAMSIPVPQGKARAFGTASLNIVKDYIEKWDSTVIGPGFGRDEDTITFTLELLRMITKPAVVDADALFAVSKDVSVVKQCKAPLILTPHPGEMATLLGTTVAEVQSNRLEIARAFAQEYGVTVVLKGAGTVVAGPDGVAYINTTGTSGMATGGTGDVLAGMIGGLLAQQMNPTEAACLAVFLHGRAGELAAEKLSEAAMIAGDVADNIGEAIKDLLMTRLSSGVQEVDSK